MRTVRRSLATNDELYSKFVEEYINLQRPIRVKQFVLEARMSVGEEKTTVNDLEFIFTTKVEIILICYHCHFSSS